MGLTAPNSLPYPDPPDLVDIPGDMQALAQAVQAALSSLSARVTALENGTGVATTKHWGTTQTRNVPGVTSWTAAGGEYSWLWTPPSAGVMLIAGMAQLNDDANQAGDPMARLGMNGAGKVSLAMGLAQLGMATGGQSISGSVPLTGVAVLNGAEVEVLVEVRTTTSNQVGEIRNAYLDALFVATE